MDVTTFVNKTSAPGSRRRKPPVPVQPRLMIFHASGISYIGGAVGVWVMEQGADDEFTNRNSDDHGSGRQPGREVASSPAGPLRPALARQRCARRRLDPAGGPERLG